MLLARINCRCLVNQISFRGIHCTPIVQSKYDTLYTQPLWRLSMLDRIKDKLGFYRYNRFRMQDSTVYMYLSCTDDLPVDNFFKHCKLPDTYLYWFSITQLHLWMIMVRCKAEGIDGVFCNKELTKRFWEDAHERIKLIGRFEIKVINEILDDLHGTYTASLVGLDEGLLSDDKVLAAALWRHFFFFEDVDPLALEMMVKYVRLQIKHISQLNGDYLLSRGRVIWKPMDPLIKLSDLPKLKVARS